MPVNLPEEIIALENHLRANPHGFSWQIHNELRHLYLPVSEYESRRHADVILRHSIMDGYVLNTLSDWHLAHKYNAYNPDLGVTVLLNTAQQYEDLAHLWAASYVRAAQVRFDHHKFQVGRVLLERALRDPRMTHMDTLRPYRTLAENLL